MNQNGLQVEIKRRVKVAGSYRKLAHELGLDAGYLWRVANGQKPGGDAVYSALGLRREVRYFRAMAGKGKA